LTSSSARAGRTHSSVSLESFHAHRRHNSRRAHHCPLRSRFGIVHRLDFYEPEISSSFFTAPQESFPLRWTKAAPRKSPPLPWNTAYRQPLAPRARDSPKSAPPPHHASVAQESLSMLGVDDNASTKLIAT